MNKVKLILWLIIIGLFGVFFFQNQAYFLSKQELGINLWVVNYQIPELPNIIYAVSFFLMGLLISYFFSLYAKYKHNHTIKTLKADLSSRADTIARLETENESLKSAMSEKSNGPDDDGDAAVEETLPIPEDEEQADTDK